MAVKKKIEISKHIGNLNLWEKSMGVNSISKQLFLKNINCEDLPEGFYKDLTTQLILI